MFILLFYFFISLILSIGLIKRYREKIDVIDLALGFCIIFFITGVCGLFFPKYCPPIIFAVSIVSIVSIIKNKKYTQISKQPLDFSLLITVFSVLYISIFVYGLNLVQKFYVNPDPSGYSSVTGLMIKHNGLINGLKAIKNYTGTSFSFAPNWDDPNAFQWRQSPWNIPDSTDKYGIANGMYLHNGGANTALIFEHWLPEVKSFWISWSSLTIFGLSIIIGLIYKICESALFMNKNLKSKKEATVNSKVKISYLTELRIVLIIIIFSSIMSSPWAIPMLWEGFLNQFWSYILTLLPIAIALSWGKMDIFEDIKTTKYEYVSYVLIILAALFVYAQQLPWIIAALLTSVAIREKHRIFKNFRQTAILVALSFIIGIISLFTPIVKSGIGYLTGSGGGGSTHLGFFSILRNFMFSAPFNYVGSPNSPVNSLGQALFQYKVLPNAGYDNLNFELRGQGYSLYTDNVNLEPTFLIFILIFNVLLYLFFLRRFLFLVILPVSQVLVMCAYLVSHLGESLRNQPDRVFNDYIWMRLSAITSILLLISILYPIFYKLNKSNRIKNFNTYILIPLIIFLFFTSYSNFKISSNLRPSSINAVVINDCDELRNIPKESFFISDSGVPELSITRCGGRYEFLNDSFPSRHIANTDTAIYYIKRDPSLDSWSINEIGILQGGVEIISPCDLTCLKNKIEFIANTQ